MLDPSPLRVPETRHLFAPLRAGLLSLLRSITPDDWNLPTVAGSWRVRDVAAHLIDGELRTLAAHRDGHDLANGDTVRGYDDVLALIGRLNAEGIAAGRHLSPRLIIDLLATTGEWMNEFAETLDLDAPALFSVAWAGEQESTNRFDLAREFTERWHHEMQIRAACGDRGNPQLLLNAEFCIPLLETSFRALPSVYANVAAAIGTTVAIEVEGLGWRRSYSLRKDADRWTLYAGVAPSADARVAGMADSWWRLLFNALPSAGASRAFRVSGGDDLVAPLWRTRSVMV